MIKYLLSRLSSISYERKYGIAPLEANEKNRGSFQNYSPKNSSSLSVRENVAIVWFRALKTIVSRNTKKGEQKSGQKKERKRKSLFRYSILTIKLVESELGTAGTTSWRGVFFGPRGEVPVSRLALAEQMRATRSTEADHRMQVARTALQRETERGNS